MDKEEWLDRYLAEQELAHRELFEHIAARETDAWGVSRCATSTPADDSAERTPSS